jgi:hypothetical protein
MAKQPKNPLLSRRGSLVAAEPGARGLEHMARNQSCVRLAALTLAAVSPAEVAEKVYGQSASEGLSPFAIRRGERFELALEADQCKRLFHLYSEAGRLRDSENVWQDISALYPGISALDLEKRRVASSKLIADRAAGVKGLPNIVLKPRLLLEVMGHGHPCEPDALVARDEDTEWQIVEIKSYADRAALTDAIKTGSACRQAAVGHLALQSTYAQLGIKVDHNEPQADLIFAKPGTNWPTLNTMSLTGEIENLSHAFSHSAEMASQILEIIGASDLDSQEVLQSLPSNPCSGCADHCPLWDDCRGEIIRSGSSSLLGDSAEELLSGVELLSQAANLRDLGSDPDPDLNLLAQLLSASDQAYQRALGEAKA